MLILPTLPSQPILESGVGTAGRGEEDLLAREESNWSGWDVLVAVGAGVVVVGVVEVDATSPTRVLGKPET